MLLQCKLEYGQDRSLAEWFVSVIRLLTYHPIAHATSSLYRLGTISRAKWIVKLSDMLFKIGDSIMAQTKTAVQPLLTFAQKLHAITVKDVLAVCKMADGNKNPQVTALLHKAGKYSLVLGKGKQAKSYHAMNVINLAGKLTHGDYHPNVARAHLAKLGFSVTWQGELPLSAVERKDDYAAFKVTQAEEKAKAEKAASRKNGKVKITTSKGKAKLAKHALDSMKIHKTGKTVKATK